MLEVLHASCKPYVVEGQSLEVVATGYRFLEGPAWNAPAGELYFNDIKGNAIYCLRPDGVVHLFRDNSWLANGNTFDREWNLVTCEHGTSRVSRTSKDGAYVVLADGWQGKCLNSPNDVIVRSDGSVLFTDPLSGRSAGFGMPRQPELDFQGVYLLDAQDGTLHLLVKDLPFPNGLCLSADEDLLYVSDTRLQLVMVYPFIGRCAVGPGRVFARLDGSGPGKADGLKLDSVGNLFSTGPGGIHVFNPDGALIGKILVPLQAANFCWGAQDLQTLYITATSALFSIRLGVPGRLH